MLRVRGTDIETGLRSYYLLRGVNERVIAKALIVSAASVRLVRMRRQALFFDPPHDALLSSEALCIVGDAQARFRFGNPDGCAPPGSSLCIGHALDHATHTRFEEY